LKGPIQSVEATYLVHATEDAEKVGGAVAKLLGAASEPVVESLEGHFGNRILRGRLHLTGEEAARAFESLVALMPQGMRDEVVADIGPYLDEHSALFLRLDKQKLVSGSVALGTGDAVRLKVKPRVFQLKGGAPRFYAQLIGGG
jgi:RNA binding exosome subunit